MATQSNAMQCNLIHFASTQNIQQLNSTDHSTIPSDKIRYNTTHCNANTIQHDTTRYYLSMTDHYTALPCAVSVACFLFLPLSLFLSPSLYLSQPQSRRTLAPAPAPAPMILHMMQSSLHDGTLSMHAFLLLLLLMLLLLLLLLFLLLLGHFDWMLLPLPLSRFASLRCVSSLLASPLLASLRLYYWSASLGLAMTTFASLLFSISYSILLYSLLFSPLLNSYMI